MKKALAFVLLVVVGSCCLFASAVADKVIVSVEDFVNLFNMYAGLTNTGHGLTDDSMDTMSAGHGVTLIKAIFNGCEVLTLTSDPFCKNVTEVICSFVVGVPGSDAYASDFIVMSIKAMLACGMDSDDVSSAMDTFDKRGVGSTVDIGGFVISFEQPDSSSMLFRIVKK